jgi:hypothetical protein
MLRITVEYLPHGNESKAEVVAHSRVCNLREHPPGAPLGNFHAYFEANAVAPRESEVTWHKVSDAIVKDYPRREGGVWDHIAVMLRAAGFGWPGEESDGQGD